MAGPELPFAEPPAREAFAADAWFLRGFALPFVDDVLVALDDIAAAAPFRHMVTPGGARMSAAMSSCGALGWVTDRRGYRYETNDPDSGRPWPVMPAAFLRLATGAAAEAGHPAFLPDECLINRYEPGARMTLHRDADERDFTQPIVSVSLGLPMAFRFGGIERQGPTQKLMLQHGGVVVWGGASRLCYHGVSPLADGGDLRRGRCRVNLTFRVAG
jgi:alkylated DNA repair protein (DNA oxidative demethylase)